MMANSPQRLVLLLLFVLLLMGNIACLATATDSDATRTTKKKKNAEKVRALVSQINWGVVSYFDTNKIESHSDDDESQGRPQGEVLSFADTNGHIFLYLMGKHNGDKLALTLTEASLPPYTNLGKAACGKDGKMDAEDPRCAKITISGTTEPCDTTNELCQQGWKALVDRHPSMANWPSDHNFIVHELKIIDIWMIANYGGQSIIDPDTYFDAKVEQELQEEEERTSQSLVTMATTTITTTTTTRTSSEQELEYPAWNKKAERARWIVARALWTTVSTVSVRLKGEAWGNIRSVVDGKSPQESSGLPVFYLPTPDASSIDIKANSNIALTLSEASLVDRLDTNGQQLCGGQDAESPICARVILLGTAKKITDKTKLKMVQEAFGTRHPYAPWLAHGGAHTGGDYMTIELEKVMILDYFGGATEVCVKKYLAVRTTSGEVEEEDHDHGNNPTMMMLRGTQSTEGDSEEK